MLSLRLDRIVGVADAPEMVMPNARSLGSCPFVIPSRGISGVGRACRGAPRQTVNKGVSCTSRIPPTSRTYLFVETQVTWCSLDGSDISLLRMTVIVGGMVNTEDQVKELDQ